MKRQNDKFNKRNTNKGASKRSRKTNYKPSNKAGYNKESEFSDELKSTTNDPSWYTQDASLVRDACSIPFVWRAGTKINDNVEEILALDSTFEYKPWNSHVPGICAIEVAPTVGYAWKPQDPVNIAATAMYSFVRHVNSGHKNYDATDMMMYNMAMCSIYSCLNWLQRLYGTAMLYSQYNMYFPAQLIRANGVDPDDLQNSLANFRFSLNVLINKAASLAVPSTLPIFRRQAFLYQNVYIEGASPKDQVYMYIPRGFYKKVFDKTAKCNKLQFILTPTLAKSKGTVRYLAKVDELIRYANDLIDAVYADEDCGIISGDILKAYSLNNVLRLAPIEADYTISPIVDLAVLEQMKNAICYGKADNLDVVEVIPTDSTSPYLQCSPDTGSNAFTNGSPSNLGVNWDKVYAANKYMITSSIDPTPAIVLENTRLMSVTMVGDTHKCICGSEIAVNFYIWYGIGEDDYNKHEYVHVLDSTLGKSNATRMGDFFTDMASFKYHPQQILFEYSYSPSASSHKHVRHNGYLMDFDNFTVITPAELERIHETALLSEYNVPLIGRAQ